MTLKPYPKTRLHIIFSEFSGMDKDLMKNREIYAFSLIIIHPPLRNSWNPIKLKNDQMIFKH